MLENRFRPKPKHKLTEKLKKIIPEPLVLKRKSPEMKTITKSPEINSIKPEDIERNERIERIERKSIKIGETNTSKVQCVSATTSLDAQEACGENIPNSIDVETLDALKEEMLMINRDNMRRFMAGISEHFSKIRTEVSREFNRLEEVHNKKWEEFLENLSQLNESGSDITPNVPEC